MTLKKDLDQKIVSLYRKISRACGQNSDRNELALLKKAVYTANEFCPSMPSSGGLRYIEQVMEVSLIVSVELGLGTTSVISALIYRLLQEGKLSPEIIKKEFGPKVLEICEGLAKISSVQSEKTSSQAENLRSLILTLARDVRVILVKIGERLFILRNMDMNDSDYAIRMASETRYIFSPLAHRMGLYNIMSEMEDVSMKFLETDAYRMIETRLRDTKSTRDRFIREFIRPIQAELDGAGLKAEIKGRPKAISSIWKKMKKQEVEFDEVYDKFAIRIILDSKARSEKADCWRAYSVVTDFYKPNPKRMRDWISVPKSNGYESLHTTVMVPGGHWVEVQIRTRRMDEIAEKGLAAHWKYKGIDGAAAVDEWLAKVRELLENPESDALTVIDDLKMSLENKEIFVFTPQGDLKKFPEGATVLDFAFDIHTEVGSSCAGAKINGVNKPIRYALQNGDKIEILRSRNQKPNMDWLNFVVTSKAKSKIKLALKEEKLKEVENGREILKRRFKNWKLEFADPLVRKLLKHYKYNDAIDMYYDIATEKLDLLAIKDVLTREEKPAESKAIPVEGEELEKLVQKAQQTENADFLVIDEKVSGVDYRLGKCCNPILGDRIFGFVTIGSGITIHRINCPNAQELVSRYGYRVVAAQWTATGRERQFLASLRITGVDDIGIVSNISEVISKDLKVNMRSFTMDSEDGLFDGTVHLFVRDTTHLNVLQRKLEKVKGVLSVRRIN